MKQKFVWSLIIVLLITASLVTVSVASATGKHPPACPPGYVEVKFEPLVEGSNGPVTVTNVSRRYGQPISLDWQSSLSIEYVIVVGHYGTNWYTYSGGANGGDHLFTPGYKGILAALCCYHGSTETPTATQTSRPTDTYTPTASRTPTLTLTPTSTETPIGTATPIETLTSTTTLLPSATVSEAGTSTQVPAYTQTGTSTQTTETATATLAPAGSETPTIVWTPTREASFTAVPSLTPVNTLTFCEIEGSATWEPNPHELVVYGFSILSKGSNGNWIISPFDTSQFAVGTRIPITWGNQVVFQWVIYVGNQRCQLDDSIELLSELVVELSHQPAWVVGASPAGHALDPYLELASWVDANLVESEEAVLYPAGTAIRRGYAFVVPEGCLFYEPISATLTAVTLSYQGESFVHVSTAEFVPAESSHCVYDINNRTLMAVSGSTVSQFALSSGVPLRYLEKAIEVWRSENNGSDLVVEGHIYPEPMGWESLK